MNDNNIAPSRADIQTYFYVVFGYLEGLIPLRSFAEKNNPNSGAVNNVWITADDEIVGRALDFANLCNQRQSACYVIPGTVSKLGQAGSSDIMQMQVLLIDIDDGDTKAKLTALTDALGAPTMIVESGGVTKEGNKKLHIYWQLARPVSGDDLQRLLHLRHQIALIFGGDTHFKSAHQPIRVAGSVYHKGGVNRLVKIRSYNPVEYELEELIESISCIPSLNDNFSLNGFKTSNNDILLNTNILPFNELLATKVYEGGNGEQTRFNHLSRVIGYWLRRAHDGLITMEQAIEEIHSYNLANVVPSWPLDRIKQTTSGLWKLHLQKYGKPKEMENKLANDKSNDAPALKITSFPLSSFLTDTSPLPEDIIAPRILTPSGMFVFGGAPKVGKSDFLLSLFVHLAAGKAFLGFVPPRPLKIFYFQAEIGYHYLRERLQNMELSPELIELAEGNLQITPNSKMLLDEDGINSLAAHIKAAFNEDPPDIIAVDPVRNVFDGGRIGATENENDAMMFFLQKRIEHLRDMVNPDAGIILVHHTKKLSKTQFDEDPFQAFSGASSLRGYYSTGALLYKPEIENNELNLIFELRNGANIPTKIIRKKDGAWIEENPLHRRIAHKTQGSLFDRERERRIRVIIGILEAEALKGKFYLMKQFAQKYQSYKNLGGRRTIYDDCSAAATLGLIKFFDNPEIYGSSLINPNSGLGFMCTKEMKIYLGKFVDPDSGKVSKSYKSILPTHYKRSGDGRRKEVTDGKIWEIEPDEIEVKNAV